MGVVAPDRVQAARCRAEQAAYVEVRGDGVVDFEQDLRALGLAHALARDLRRGRALCLDGLRFFVHR
jgi:hypothetical protein